MMEPEKGYEELSEDYGLSVIVPCFNEAANLVDTIRMVDKAAAEANIPTEIIIVDDGSTDGTYHIAQKIAEGREDITPKRSRVNLGIGAAFWAGVGVARKSQAP